MGASSSTQKMAPLPPVILNPTARHTATVIFLHGLGDTGHGWASSFEALKRDYIKYIFPTANKIPVSLNGGFVMSSWFDLYSLSFDGQEDEVGIENAAKQLLNLVEAEEKQGIASNRIIIGGFSQGGAVSLYSSVFSGKKLGGILGLSTWMPLHKNVQQKQITSDVPVFQGHGSADPIVQFKYGKMTSDLLKTIFSNHVLKTYSNMMHSSCQEEMNDVKEFIDKVLPKV